MCEVLVFSLVTYLGSGAATLWAFRLSAALIVSVHVYQSHTLTNRTHGQRQGSWILYSSDTKGFRFNKVPHISKITFKHSPSKESPLTRREIIERFNDFYSHAETWRVEPGGQLPRATAAHSNSGATRHVDINPRGSMRVETSVLCKRLTPSEPQPTTTSLVTPSCPLTPCVLARWI